MSTWTDIDERDDHYLGLAGANVVATEALLVLRDNLLRREPMLSSRVYVWQEFRRLDREQVLAVIPAYHPVWADADPGDIAYADVHAGHGNFRAWSKITAHVVTALARLDTGWTPSSSQGQRRPGGRWPPGW